MRGLADAGAFVAKTGWELDRRQQALLEDSFRVAYLVSGVVLCVSSRLWTRINVTVLHLHQDFARLQLIEHNRRQRKVGLGLADHKGQGRSVGRACHGCCL